MILNQVDGIEFYTEEQYPLEVLQKAQSRLLEMLDEVQGILEPEGIPVIAAYGTMLGAVRHGGFIPWDDDLDVCIPDEQYYHALELLRKRLGDSIIVQDSLTEPRYWCGWSKLRDTGSEVLCSMWPEDNTLVHRGICLDLHRLKKSTAAAHKREVSRQRMQKAMDRCRRTLREKNGLPQKLKVIAACALRVAKHGLAQLLVLPDRTVRYYVAEGSVVERCYAPETVYPLSKATFEGRSLWLPADADKALTGDYGDYMRLPSPENRKPHYAKITFGE